MDRQSLIAAIERKLRAHPTPPVSVLEEIVGVLSSARGGGGDRSASSRGDDDVVSSLLADSCSVSEAATTPAVHAWDALGGPDPRMEAVKARHSRRAANLKPPDDVRALKTRQLQALHEGRGGKYVHADYVGNGVTQIGGLTTRTPSMTADGALPSRVGAALAKGKWPARVNGPDDFRF